VNAAAKFEVRIALPVPGIIAIGVLAVVALRTSNLGKGGEGVGSGIPPERALVSSYIVPSW